MSTHGVTYHRDSARCGRRQQRAWGNKQATNFMRAEDHFAHRGVVLGRGQVGRCLVTPSVLSTSFTHLNRSATGTLTTNTSIIRFSIVSGRCIPGLAVKPVILGSLHGCNVATPVSMRLVIGPISHVIPSFTTTNTDVVAFRPRTSRRISHALRLVGRGNYGTNLMFGPTAPLDCLSCIVSGLSIVLLVSIGPNFNNRSFVPRALSGLHRMHHHVSRSNFSVQLRISNNIGIGGVNRVTTTNTSVFITNSTVFSRPSCGGIVSRVHDRLTGMDRRWI